MKVRNEYVNIKVGNKECKKHNFFLNKYLKLYSKSQLNKDNAMIMSFQKLFDRVYLKLDNQLQVDYDTDLKPQDFELELVNNLISNVLGTKNTITATYYVNNSDGFYLNGALEFDRSKLIGYKITGIAFGDSENVYTFLDTTDYNLEIIDESLIDISRKDLITTDAICSYDYPVHLAPRNINGEYAYLYSVGLGRRSGAMEEEYIIDDAIKINEDDDYTYSFLLTKAIDVGIYPCNECYPSITTYPTTFKIKTSIYPQLNLYCGDNIFPSSADYKYIIYKYKIYNSKGYVGEYTMSLYTEKEGILTIKDKIERNDK